MSKELLETIKIEDGHVFNIEWHNRRLNKSRLELFGEKKKLYIQEFLKNIPQQGLLRSRLIYTQTISSIEYIPYQEKQFSTFKVVPSQIEYAYKYNNRKALNLLAEKGYDEIIIEKNGLLTDTSIANIAFFNGISWCTPKSPLLEGTTRERLLNEGFLELKDIKKEDIKKYSHFALMNAMIGFQIQKSINIRL